MISPPSSRRTASWWHSQAVPATGHPWGREDSAPRLGVIVHYPSSIVKRDGCHWPPKRCFDKMSNEGLDSALPRTKIRLGGFQGPSQAICKIHIDTNSLQALSSRHNLRATSFPCDSRIPTQHTWWYLPIYWHASSSSERNPEFLPFILRTFDFHGWNNIVWEVKLYCLTRQTLVFRTWNNIVWASKCKYFENKMYSFLK